MKKRLLPALLLLSVLLTGCTVTTREYAKATGQVLQMETDENGCLTAFVVADDGGEEFGFRMTQASYVLGPAKGESKWAPDSVKEDFLSGRLERVRVAVFSAGRSKEALTGSEGKALKTYDVDNVWLKALPSGESITLSDGTEVERWDGEDYYDQLYLHPNGTPLLAVRTGTELAITVFPSGEVPLSALDPQVLEAIQTYFDDRGLLYDVNVSLEAAYADYTSDPKRFTQHHFLSQDTSPTARSERVIYFSTVVQINGSSNYWQDIGDAFDLATGAHLDNAELFTVPMEELPGLLLDRKKVWDEDTRREVTAAFTPEGLCFYPKSLQIFFPHGTVPSREGKGQYGLVSYYEEDSLAELLHPWALPISEEK